MEEETVQMLAMETLVVDPVMVTVPEKAAVVPSAESGEATVDKKVMTQWEEAEKES